MAQQIAVVTGASRGAGKGIARALATRGYKVYVTGRSERTTDAAVGGTLAETVAEIAACGGQAVAVACDHRDDQQVQALFERVSAEAGRLDILVNNAAYLPDATTTDEGFWNKPIEMADLITVGLRSHYIASYYAALIMLPQQHGLIVNTGYYGAVCYFHGPAYGAQKAGSDKMAADMAKELRPHGIAALSLWMGNLRTERTLAYVNSLAAERRVAILGNMETPDFTGMVIDALYRDPHLLELSGKAHIGAELAKGYGLTDLDGTSPPSFRDTLGGPPMLHPSLLL